jgi:hypothetical protein
MPPAIRKDPEKLKYWMNRVVDSVNTYNQLKQIGVSEEVWGVWGVGSVYVQTSILVLIKATNFSPLALDATLCQDAAGALLCVQLALGLVDVSNVQIPVVPIVEPMTATNFSPDSSDATLYQYAAGALVLFVQIALELVDVSSVQIPVLVPLVILMTATNFCPVSSDATLVQPAAGALVLFVQLAPESLDVQIPLVIPVVA